MHVVLAFLGTAVTLLVVLHRLADAGIELGGLNPFAWRRRRAWRQKFEANPMFSIEDPREVAALLVVGAAKIDGDMSAAEKQAVLAEFERTFAATPREASALLSSSVHLLGDLAVLRTQLDGILARSRERLNAEQIASLLSMMERVATVDGPATEHQRELIDGVREGLSSPALPRGIWG